MAPQPLIARQLIGAQGGVQGGWGNCRRAGVLAAWTLFSVSRLFADLASVPAELFAVELSDEQQVAVPLQPFIRYEQYFARGQHVFLLATEDGVAQVAEWDSEPPVVYQYRHLCL